MKRLLLILAMMGCLALPPVFLGAVSYLPQIQIASDDEPAPALVLKAPVTCVVGELVRLDLRESIVGGVEWRVLPETPDFEVIEDGRRAFFSSRVPGSYLFIVAGAKGDTALLTHHTIVVAGQDGTPAPGPTDQTLAQKVTVWVAAVVDDADKAVHLKGLIGVFRKMAESSDVQVEQIIEATALANSAVLGESLEAWIPFLDKLGEALDVLSDGGKLDTRDQYREIWLEIAKGLEAALPKEAS